MRNKVLHSIRIAEYTWYDPDNYLNLLKLLKKYDCGISQIALFTATTHIPLTFEELDRRLEIIKERIAIAKAEGFECGINILATIGHHCEQLENGLGDKYTYMTNIDGEVCKGSYCMRNEKYLDEYVKPAYTKLCKADPDFIWIDDDVRYGHMPIGWGCFCDNCIDTFNRKNNFSYTREELKKELNKENVPLRKLWLDHQSDAIVNLLATIGKTVRDIDEGITLGFMTGERYFEGYQFERYANALSDNGKYEIMWRPGGGAYEDENYRNHIVRKQEQSGRQNAYLPSCVTVIQSEIENFPHQLIKKSPKSTAIEASMSMTVGCTGAAFNIVPSETGEKAETVIPHLKAIAKLNKFYKKQAELLKGLTPEGIHTGWSIYSQSAVPEGRYFDTDGEIYATFAREIFTLGLPECYRNDKANVTMFKGKSPAAYEKEDLEKILSGAVYLDSKALDTLNETGFSEFTGFETEKEISVDAREYYLSHPVNEGIEKGSRNGRQAFHPNDAYGFKSTKENFENLASIVDYRDKVMADCCLGIYENQKGGKVCVAGYYPFDWVSDTFKAKQLKRLFVYLSKGKLISFVDSYHLIRNITLTDENRICVTLYNTTNDDSGKVTVAVRTDKKCGKLHFMYKNSRKIKSKKQQKIYGGCYQFFEIDNISPFEGVIIEL